MTSWMWSNATMHNATIKSPSGAPEVVRYAIKHVWIFLKLAKFYTHVDWYDKTDSK